MKKKFGAVLMAGLMACTVTAGVAFSGCGGMVSIPTFEMPEGGYDGSKVTITFANTTGQRLEDIVADAIKRFNDLYPNITVKVDNTNKSYDTLNSKISTQLTTGKQPNVAFCYSDHVAQYNRSGAVVALDEFFLPGSEYSEIMVTNAKGQEEPLGLTDVQVRDYVDAFYDEGKVYEDGHIYTLPFAKSTEALYYNEDFFTAHNLTVPTTWAEMWKTCQDILEIIGDDLTKYPLGYDSDANWFITMCKQYGSPYTSKEVGKHFQFDNEKNREFVKELHGYFKDGYFTTQNTYGSFTSNLFTKGNCYMSIGSTGGSSYQETSSTDGAAEFNVGVTRIPQIDVDNPQSILQGPSVCIFQDSNPQKVIASWLLIKFLTRDPEFQGRYSQTSGYIPVIKSIFENPTYLTFLNGKTLIARTANMCKELVDEGAFYTSDAFVGSSKAREQVGLLMKTALLTGNIEKAFADALKECRYFAGN